MGCTVVLRECGSAGLEIPDVIAWRNGWSIVVEVKTSRADFLADRNKMFRIHPERGMGTTRWFFTAKGLLKLEELPSKWGLAEWHKDRVYKKKKPEAFTEHNMRAEQNILVSALERATDMWGLRIFGGALPLVLEGDPDPPRYHESKPKR